ncbi:MAG: MarR family transcriptional regulator [Nocardioidaceae bacterium]|nr:MarR family transcriptional regulator [Nocardioidaceae bacterium]
MDSADRQQLASDLTVYAARLVRLVRRSHAPHAGTRVLSILDENGPLGVSALAHVDRCSQPTMTGQVKQLIELGWVSRQDHPADARSTLIGLTEAGRVELMRIRRASADLVTERLDHTQFNLADLATAVAVLRAVLDEQEPS